MYMHTGTDGAIILRGWYTNSISLQQRSVLPAWRWNSKGTWWWISISEGYDAAWGTS